MRRLILSLTVFALLAGRAVAQPKAPFQTPSGPPPTFLVLTGVDPKAQTVAYTSQVTSHIPQPVTMTIIQNGMQVKVTKTVFVTQMQLVTRKMALKAMKITDSAGKALTTEQALERLRPGSILMQSADGRPVDAIYLRALRPETLVIVPAAPMGTEPVPAPPR